MTKKGREVFFWYLNQVQISDPKSKVKIDIQLERVNDLTTEIEKVKKFRDKAIVHRDKKTFEESEEFWKKGRTTDYSRSGNVSKGGF